MPVTFYAFGRDGGHRTFAAADGTPYCELTGPAALLLTVCPTLAMSFESNLLVPYSVFWQLFRLVLVGSPQLLQRSFSKTVLHVGGPISVILDTVMVYAQLNNDLGQRRPYQIPGWIDRLVDGAVKVQLGSRPPYPTQGRRGYLSHPASPRARLMRPCAFWSAGGCVLVHHARPMHARVAC